MKPCTSSIVQLNSSYFYSFEIRRNILNICLLIGSVLDFYQYNDSLPFLKLEITECFLWLFCLFNNGQ